MKRAVKLVLGTLLLLGPGGLSAAESPAEPRASEGPVLVIRPTMGPEEREQRDAEGMLEWERLRQEVTDWRHRWDPAVRPVRNAVDEALRSLRVTWGPYSRNLGYAVLEELARLRRQAVLPAPDPELDTRLRRALAELEQGGDFCLRGMPTRALLRLEQGRRRIEQALQAFAPGAPPRLQGGLRLRVLPRGR
jgi:hypothetical protein